MRKKCLLFSAISFAMAVVICVCTYLLYHYLSPDGGFTTVFQTEPAKPLVTLYVGLWGILQYFAAVTSLLVGFIFFSKERQEK